MFYFPASTWWMRLMYPDFIWGIDTAEKKLYLTFDDGPEPRATTFVLDELKKYNAFATFFCIGENVMKHPELYKRILDEGHLTGNHTQHHLNGWKTSTARYIENIRLAAERIDSRFFRPPYGRMKKAQLRKLKEVLGRNDPKVVMWSVLSADFDRSRSGHDCFAIVRRHAREGSIIVFHDSEKAFPNLSVALPHTLQYFSEIGFSFETLPG